MGYKLDPKYRVVVTMILRINACIHGRIHQRSNSVPSIGFYCDINIPINKSDHLSKNQHNYICTPVKVINFIIKPVWKSAYTPSVIKSLYLSKRILLIITDHNLNQRCILCWFSLRGSQICMLSCSIK